MPRCTLDLRSRLLLAQASAMQQGYFPKTNVKFWMNKFEENVTDRRVTRRSGIWMAVP